MLRVPPLRPRRLRSHSIPKLTQRANLLEQCPVQDFPIDPGRLLDRSRHLNCLGRSDHPVSSRVEILCRQLVKHEFVVVRADDERGLLVDHSQAGHDPPLEIEEPMSLAEADPRVRIDCTGSRHGEVQGAEGLYEVEVDRFPEDQRTIERSGEAFGSLRYIAGADKVEPHGHGDRLEHWSAFLDDLRTVDVEAVVRSDEYGPVAVVKGQRSKGAWEALATRVVRVVTGEVVPETGVWARHPTHPIPDLAANCHPGSCQTAFVRSCRSRHAISTLRRVHLADPPGV